MNLKIKGTIMNIPTDQDIITAEKELGLSLPKSYIDFVQTYGTGQLCELFNIFVPEVDNENINLAIASKATREFIHESTDMGLWGESKPKVDTKWIDSLIPFGNSDNGDILCWDTEKKDDDGEYPIVFLENEQAFAFVAANSMEEFVDEFCINGEIDILYPVGDGTTWELEGIFQPY
jgi:hypothetical protein